MDSHVWFDASIAVAIIVIALVSLALYAPFIPRFIRARDGRGLVGLAFAYLIMGGWLFVGVHGLLQTQVV